MIGPELSTKFKGVDIMRNSMKALVILLFFAMAIFGGWATGKEVAENHVEKEITQSYVKKSITSEMAERLINAAEKKAEEIGVPMVIAIVDESGNLKAFRRMDDAPLLSINVAIDKGYTAVGFGLSTHEMYDFIKNDGPLLTGVPELPRMIVFGGGYPIKEDNKIIGGIGVSGGHYSQDMEVAEAALEILK